MPLSDTPPTIPARTLALPLSSADERSDVRVLGSEVLLDLDRTVLVKGDVVRGVVGIESLDERTGARGPWYLLVVANQTGRSELKAWSETAGAMRGIKAGDVVWVEARVGDGWPDKTDVGLTLLTIRRSTVAVDVWDLMMPSFRGDPADLDVRWARLLHGVHGPLLALLSAVWREYDLAAFREAPGARGDGHHAYRHGLYEHSIEVAELVDAACRLPRYRGRLDRDFAVVAALLHDLGKLTEYRWRGGPIMRSARGRMSYHTVLGPRMLERVWVKHEDSLIELGVTQRLIDDLAHVMESHHATAEHGSPTAPIFTVAMLVAKADDLSAAVTGIDDATTRDRSADVDGFSTRRIPFRPNGVYHQRLPESDTAPESAADWTAADIAMHL